jgi:hypothetical protein
VTKRIHAGAAIPVLASLGTLLLMVMACGCIEQTVELLGGEREDVLEFAGPITENIMAGYNENNYTRYSMDFGDAMTRQLTPSRFSEQREEIHGKVGLYISKAGPRVYQRGRYVWAEYDAEFEKESGVRIRVVFEKDNPEHLVEGLWFDSPKLRG